jgi:hypothetical protein
MIFQHHQETRMPEVPDGSGDTEGIRSMFLFLRMAHKSSCSSVC